MVPPPRRRWTCPSCRWWPTPRPERTARRRRGRTRRRTGCSRSPRPISRRWLSPDWTRARCGPRTPPRREPERSSSSRCPRPRRASERWPSSAWATTVQGMLAWAGAALGRAARDRDELLVGIPVQSAEHTRALVEGRSSGLLSGRPGPRRRDTARWASSPGLPRRACSGRRRAHAAASVLARSLVAVPSNIKSPAWLAAQAKTGRQGRRGHRDGVVPAALRQGRLRGLIAVGGGSTNPPGSSGSTMSRRATSASRRRPAGDAGSTMSSRREGASPSTAVGSTSPPASMLTMKTDMTGRPSSLLSRCRQGLEIPVRVTGLLPLAENAVSGSAYRPGDVVTQYGGTTVEIGNTDAEGRIVLADALAYADSQLDPDVLIDVATLTGAATLALGRSIGPLFSTDERLQEALLAAGRAAGEPMWPFPPWMTTAPARLTGGRPGHVSSKPPWPEPSSLRSSRGSSPGRAWAHLDIAGPGRPRPTRGRTRWAGLGMARASCCVTWRACADLGGRPWPRADGGRGPTAVPLSGPGRRPARRRPLPPPASPAARRSRSAAG